MEFLANENFPLLSVMLLRNAGYRVVGIAQESPGITDFEVLKRAHEENMVILTFDRDYGELIYKNRVLLPAGVVYFRFGPATPAEPADILIKLIGRTDLSIIGQFTILERGRLRQRSLKIANI